MTSVTGARERYLSLFGAGSIENEGDRPISPKDIFPFAGRSDKKGLPAGMGGKAATLYLISL
jgi:hypothetical protein